eukprot:INCI18174.1.p1 GENE.INCI18174.1~~INCI18174.1.p1  ORF type:complete len:205 (+),score=34.67 INCI18174.1:314-928(+)
MQTGEFDSLDAGPHSAGGAAEGTADNNNTATTTAIVIHAQIVSGVVTGKGTANEHVSYNILTTVRNSAQGLPRQFRIARRFSHFVTLHTQLGNVYADLAAASASAHIPELPSLPSKTLTKHKNPKFIAARREKLAVYLQQVIDQRIPETERLVYSFLGASEISSLDRYAVDSWVMRTGGAGMLVADTSNTSDSSPRRRSRCNIL